MNQTTSYFVFRLFGTKRSGRNDLLSEKIEIGFKEAQDGVRALFKRICRKHWKINLKWLYQFKIQILFLLFPGRMTQIWNVFFFAVGALMA